MVFEVEDVIKDPHLQEREFFAESVHPIAGEVTFPGAPFGMSATPWQLNSPAPTLGQHNQEVFTDILGHEPDAIERWREQGVV